MAMKQIQQTLFPELSTPKPAVQRRRPPRPLPRRRRLPLWLALHLPRLPLEALFRDDSTAARAAIAGAGVVRVQAVNAAAAAAGVRPGMTLAAAWSLLPDLDVRERDERRERELLLRLAHRASRFTPVVCLDEQSLLLEVRGSLQLFGGAASLREKVRDDLRGLGFETAVSMAPTPRAAFWLARAACDAHADTPEELAAMLAPLPLTILGLEEKRLDSLRGIGARRLGDVMRLPRDGLARRYGARLLRELDQALGRMPDVRCAVPRARHFAAKLDLLYEVTDVERLRHPVEQLLDELDVHLVTTQQGASRLQLQFRHRDHSMTRLTVGFAAATRDAARIRSLVEQKLESLELPAPVLAVGMLSRDLVALAGSDRPLFREQDDGADWPELVERLQMRLGHAAVRGIEPYADHRPERAWRYVEPGSAREAPGVALRPHWLLETPEPIRFRQGQPVLGGPLRLLAGPERIETGWWDEADVSRDYFVAQDTHGRRLWVCREVKSGRWWLQGIFG